MEIERGYKQTTIERKERYKMKFLIFLVGVFFYPKTVYAYVDPGFISVLYQFAYVVIFGALASFVLRPWRFLKLWVQKLFPWKQSGSSGKS